MVPINFIFKSVICGCIACSSCNFFSGNEQLAIIESDSGTITQPSPEQVHADVIVFDSVSVGNVAGKSTHSGNEVLREQLLEYAKTLLGTPYKYASIDPDEGLDCSGFITHVFTHFSIQVPRSSVDFTNYGTTLNNNEAEPGDLILFTGTDTLLEVVGHMGIVTAVSDGILEFIHSTSGKAYGVTITSLNAHYRKRFVKVIRIPFTVTEGGLQKK